MEKGKQHRVKIAVSLALAALVVVSFLNTAVAYPYHYDFKSDDPYPWTNINTTKYLLKSFATNQNNNFYNNILLNFSNKGENPLNVIYNITLEDDHPSDKFVGDFKLQSNESKTIKEILAQKNLRNFSIYSNITINPEISKQKQFSTSFKFSFSRRWYK